jgi:hypothetical protein
MYEERTEVGGEERNRGRQLRSRNALRAPTSEPRGRKGLKVASYLGPGDDIAEIFRTRP